MSDDAGNVRREIERIRRVSDMLCTGHAHLRDRYARRALILDLGILGLATWLVALAFVDPKIAEALTPFTLAPQPWGGLLAVGTFFMTLVQLKTDWKARSEAHRRTLEFYAEAKSEAGYLLAGSSTAQDAFRRVLAKYDMASTVGVEIPERDFLRLKRRHLTKVTMSRYLDERASASLRLATAQFQSRAD
jgi:hypothetical protein